LSANHGCDKASRCFLSARQLAAMAFKSKRWTVSNAIPVAFVLYLIVSTWALHAFLHLWPLLNSERGGEGFERGVWQACVSQATTLLLLMSLVRAMATDPGSVPDTPEWRGPAVARMPVQGQRTGEPTGPPRQEVHESKRSGRRRHCKWCDKYKPDRCHHCRVCQSCILRMDHHCPWVANCIGYNNHKYFLLVVTYGLISSVIVFQTMGRTIAESKSEECSQWFRFGLVLGRSQAFLVMCLLSAFLPWHLWLTSQAMTTIEFCEKRYGPGNLVSYDHGPWANARAVLGERVLLWPLPLAAPTGGGVYFERADASHVRDAGHLALPFPGWQPAALQEPVDHNDDSPGPRMRGFLDCPGSPIHDEPIAGEENQPDLWRR